MRYAFLVDPAIASDVLAAALDGCFTLQGFYQSILQPVLDGADAAAINAYELMCDWWRAACTVDGTPESVIGFYLRQSTLPLVNQRLTSWAQRQRVH